MPACAAAEPAPVGSAASCRTCHHLLPFCRTRAPATRLARPPPSHHLRRWVPSDSAKALLETIFSADSVRAGSARAVDRARHCAVGRTAGPPAASSAAPRVASHTAVQSTSGRRRGGGGCAASWRVAVPCGCTCLWSRACCRCSPPLASCCSRERSALHTDCRSQTGRAPSSSLPSSFPHLTVRLTGRARRGRRPPWHSSRHSRCARNWRPSSASTRVKCRFGSR